ncbi:polyisoprenoid-binding protein YceI [Ulvibacter sp. MAR_2010_11]|uniref:YceI family protein n=1 Tax=Ulvibacter sp. MAR_2010_11 TaxID=1250229 RepID=UPI000C2B961D|nr:YceI family protein [Ulvibacter sp. MAR_2010_11]PKA82022.1 polyisoprenoid-binding protein YceI [Ulvibacter sp. MAR_2010_11]
MKNSIKKLGAIAIVAFVGVSFTTNDSKKEIKVEKSKIVWKGHKVTGSHQGTIDIKSGYLSFNEGKLTDGEFFIDMSTITNTDLEGESKGNLEGHLKSDDFFGIEKHPTASLVFKNIKSINKNTYKVTGDITIKEITESITFNLSVHANKANASLKIDRTKFGVRFGSSSFFDGLKDKAIYDEFDLIVDLEF